MIPEAHCIHQATGRLRVSIPSLKGHKDFFTYAEEQLARCPLVNAAKANHATGSVLITHSGDMRSIAEYAHKNRIFQLIPEKKFPVNMANATLNTYKTLDAQIQKVSGGGLDLPQTACLALVGTGIYQISRGKFAAPAWYTAFWFALNIFMRAQENKTLEDNLNLHGKG